MSTGAKESILRIQSIRFETSGFSLGPISLDLREGQVLSVIGPNGAGKTTLLRLISGLDTPASGQVIFRGRDVSSLPPHKRNLGFVFQDLALFPHMTVRQNVEYGLRVRGDGAEEVSRRVDRLLEDFNLTSYANRLPGELSGGERQRLAIARSLAPHPSILLLDEPLSSVDPEQRRIFQAELKAMLTKLGVTALHVTHDLEEGAYFSDKLAVMMEGKLAQYGDTDDVFLHPLNTRIARFLGYNVWKEDGQWMACLPSAMSVERPEIGTGRKGTLLTVGRAIGGLTMMVGLPGLQAVRIDVHRVDPWIAALKTGDTVSVVATQVQTLSE